MTFIEFLDKHYDGTWCIVVAGMVLVGWWVMCHYVSKR